MPTDKKFPDDFTQLIAARDVKVFCDDGTNSGYVTLAEAISLIEIGDLPGGGAPDAHDFVFNQMSPSSAWVINHNLGRYPGVTVVDSSRREVEGDVLYNSNNRITVSFAAPFSGTAFLN